MSEQQRIFVAVALCVAIMLAWPLLVPRQPSEEPRPAAAPAEQQQRESQPSPATPEEPQDAETTEAPSPEDESEAQEPPAKVEEKTESFSTELTRGAVSNIPLSLTDLKLLKYDERVPEDAEEEVPQAAPVSLVTAKHEGKERQAWVSWQLGDAKAPALQWVERDGKMVLEGRSASGLELRATVVPGEKPYAIEYTLNATNRTDEPLDVGASVTLALALGPRAKSSWFAPPANQMNAICATREEIERVKDDELVEEGAWASTAPALWAGIDRQYFVVALVPSQAFPASCRLSATKDEQVAVDFTFEPQELAAAGSWERSFTVYLGPKRDENLEAVAPVLDEVIDYNIWGIPLGFLARPMVALLNVFHAWTTSWGVAILVLTLLVKLILFPITYKSSVSMRKMQLLKPELERIKKQFENDRERQQLEQMKLFKEKGVNPLGGCLPMLLQMPVWLALYRTLWTSVDLYQESFLWLPDLTAKEPFPVMALAIGAITFLQQRLMPTATDSQQAKMLMYFMPVMLTVFMLALPSGLVLYILCNSVLTIFQQLAINKRTTSLG